MPRNAAVYSATLFVAVPRNLNLRSITFPHESVIYTPHPAYHGFPLDPPSV